MWQDVLMIIAISLGGYSIYNFIFIVIKKFLNRKKVSKMVCTLKSKKRYYSLVGVAILFANVIGLRQKTQEEIIISKYIINIGTNRFYNEIGSLNKFIIYILGIFLIANFVLSIYIKPIMYEEGIICENGSFLPWDKIKSINTGQNTLGNKKYIVINTVNNKEMFFSITTEESNYVKEIIFNKTGIVNKEIVTEFN